jgi:putative acyl-CoA dehydrogenase
MPTLNQPKLKPEFNAWTGNAILKSAVVREGGGWVDERATELGQLIGSHRMQSLADKANRNVPRLHTHNQFGDRVDVVEYDAAYHELMSLAMGAGLHSIAWNENRPGGFVARAALNYLWNQAENGTSCPITMAFASVHLIRMNSKLAAEWEPKMLALSYDSRPIHISQKHSVIVGMAMTEKQGGSDLRSTVSKATLQSDGVYLLNGHKWFCSAPMCDAFLTLAQTGAGVTCFLVPRWLADGSSNAIHIQRLKDKCGNRSNASAEIEYNGAQGLLIGEEGRGIATLIEMAQMTRLDLVTTTAGMMRGGLNEALHYCGERKAFGKTLIDQPMMQCVLADLCLETEAAALLALRLARALDSAPREPAESLLERVLTPTAKYWLAKRNPTFMGEAMECMGGNGYIEEGPMARFYREAPLNSIWEGSGNVACLDVLRSIQRTPDCVDILLDEIRAGSSGDARLSKFAERLQREISADSTQSNGRRIVEMAALGFQSSLMAQYAPSWAADAFISSRLDGDWGRAFGTLPHGTRFSEIIERSQVS